MRIKDSGTVEIEKELLYLDYPVLTVAHIRRELYLIETVDNDEGIFLASKTTYKELLKMLNKKVDMRSAILESSKLFYIKYENENNQYVKEDIEAANIPDDDLPDRDAYYTLDNEEITRYKYYVLSKIGRQDFHRRNGIIDSKKWCEVKGVKDYAVRINDVNAFMPEVDGIKYVKVGKCRVKQTTGVVQLEPRGGAFNKCLFV